jgi:hypothetical protein
VVAQHVNTRTKTNCIARYKEMNPGGASTTTKHCAQCHTPLDANKLTGCPCKAVDYCGTECQKFHWKTHRKEHRRRIKTIADTSTPVNAVASGETKTPSTSSSTPSEANVVVHVPEDCNTLDEAVKRVHEDGRLTTIVLGKGEHLIDKNLQICSAMSIVGRPDVPKEKILVLGAITFMKGIQGRCHLQHLLLRQSEFHGVTGGSSFSAEDVTVELCELAGVRVIGTGVVGKCTNVEVRQCEGSGMLAVGGGSIILIGAKTTVHHNCTTGRSSER